MHLTVKRITAEIDDVNDEYLFRRDESGNIRALIRVEDNKFVSPYEILNLLVRMNILRNVPLDGSKVQCLATAKLPKGAMRVQSDKGSEPILSISFELDCWHEVNTNSLSGGNYYEYSDPDGVILQRAEFKTDIEGLPFLLSVQVAPIKPKPPL